MYENAKEAKKLRWHNERICDGKYLWHLADSLQWKKIDEMFLDFVGSQETFGLGFTQMKSILMVLLVVHIVYGWFS